MYSTDSYYFPDGLTPSVIDALIVAAYESADDAAEPTARLLNGTAATRRRRRIERRTVAETVRTFPALGATTANEREAA